ncbi:hypothetical protein Ssi03_12770 [Sphaerisporangium siamense]|uniref:Uncharacterized protein n=1 Tax=Sphaerisporangium siamense TaxID=795645 RepID=A0A7W7GBY2_9ACTN|nr:hypothetical protein [Sphaerisporangium siamense]MBB4702954.1 hypothetical protein [Sphaerisporangium siamense]GII83287.1 hypothetical protein Ssi03_12770 [Sphaerisporangium siamense]
MDNPQNTPPANDPATPPTPAPNQEVGSEVTDWKAEAEKWKHFARTHETNWKKASGEVEELRKAHMTDAERAVADARAQGAREALESVVQQRAQDRLDVAASKAGVDLTPVKELLDVNKFIADGAVNETAISEFVARFSETAPKGPRFAQGLGIGPQGDQRTAGQLSRADLKGMSPREVAQAQKEGRLDALMRGEI